MQRLPFEIPGSDGLPIRGDVDLPDGDGPFAVIVGVHGFKGFRRWGFWPHFATAFAERGFAVVRFDMSHNGVGPEGLVFDEKDLFERNTLAREEADLDAVLAALRAGALPAAGRVDSARLALLGHSRGGGVAVLHAARDDTVRAVAVLASISTVRRFPPELLEQGLTDGYIPIKNMRTGEVLRFGRDSILEVRDRADVQDIASSHAAHLRCPLLAVHGVGDPSVSCEEGRSLAEAAPQGRFLPYDDCDHVLNCRHPWQGPTDLFHRFVDDASSFLRPLLG